ncbi:MAG TPA: hypothetical protein VGG19_04580 [Tepidisphaeraceae bacterium]|jgi:type II secretory pathway component GspD/PulD (secretin)
MNAERRTLNAERSPSPFSFIVHRSSFSVFLFLAGLASAQTTQPVAADLNFESTPLAVAIDSIQQRTGLNFAIDWNAIATLGVDKTTPVSFNAHGLSAGKALDLILSSVVPNHQLTFYVDKGIVHITTQAVADQDMITRVYDISDLLVRHESFQNVPFLNIANTQAATVGGGSQQSSLQASGQPNPQELEQQKQKTVDAIIAAITSSIRPEIWKQNGGKASIIFINGNLIITAPRSVFAMLGTGH